MKLKAKAARRLGSVAYVGNYHRGGLGPFSVALGPTL